MATPAEFSEVMTYLEVALGAPQTAADRLKVYRDLLGHLAGEVLRAAAIRVIAEHRFPTLPTVAEILRHAREVMHPGGSAGEAWQAVRAFAEQWRPWLLDGLPTDAKTLARYTAGRAALPDLARQAADAYGWEAVCMTDPGVGFAQFRGVWESLDARQRVEAVLPARAPALAALTNGVGLMPAIAKGGQP